MVKGLMPKHKQAFCGYFLITSEDRRNIGVRGDQERKENLGFQGIVGMINGNRDQK